jgi:hypothetical protein
MSGLSSPFDGLFSKLSVKGHISFPHCRRTGIVLFMISVSLARAAKALFALLAFFFGVFTVFFLTYIPPFASASCLLMEGSGWVMEDHWICDAMEWMGCAGVWTGELCIAYIPVCVEFNGYLRDARDITLDRARKGWRDGKWEGSSGLRARERHL